MASIVLAFYIVVVAVFFLVLLLAGAVLVLDTVIEIVSEWFG